MLSRYQLTWLSISSLTRVNFWQSVKFHRTNRIDQGAKKNVEPRNREEISISKAVSGQYAKRLVYIHEFYFCLTVEIRILFLIFP